MNNNRFVKTKLATSVSLILGALSTPLYAADEVADEDVEVIQVKGIRGSVIKSMDLKRSSTGIVDAISAEDIGKFPDTNLAESLQRISGVSIDRNNGEGQKVTVRGFGPDRNLVLLNGRQLPNTNGDRSFNFDNLAAEAISGAEVYKTAVAKMPTGGIGASVNIQTNKPLAIGEERTSLGIKMVTDTSTESGSTTPELSGLYSNVFADGKLGVSISASYAERDSGSQQAEVGTGWRTFEAKNIGTGEWGGLRDTDVPNQTNIPSGSDIYSVPQTTIYKFEEQQRKRLNSQLVLQYEVSEDIRATVDYMYVNKEVDRQYNDVSAWFTFSPSENVWSDGPIASPLLYSEEYDNLNDFSMAGSVSGTKEEMNSIGFNVEWTVNDNLKLELDHHSSTASGSPNSPYGSSNTISTAAFVRSAAATDFTGDLPILAVKGSAGVRPQDMRVTGSWFRNELSETEVDQTQLHGSYNLDEMGSIDFGVSMMTASNHHQAVQVQRNDWGGVGAEGDFDDSMFPSTSVQDKFDQVSGGDFNDFDGDYEIVDKIFMWDFEAVRERAESLYTPAGVIAGAGDCGTMFCPSTDYARDTDRFIEESMTSMYIQYNYDGEIGDMIYDVHVGIRHENTEITGTSSVPNFVGAKWEGETEIVLVPDGTFVYLSKDGDYSHTLPSINFNIELTEDLVARAAYSKTIGRPWYGQLIGGTTVGVQYNKAGGSGSAGDPGLLPLESTNIDLSLEWYYDEGSYASISYFDKSVTNDIAGTQISENLFGIDDPVNSDWYDEAVAAVGSDARNQRQYIYDTYNESHPEYVYMEDGKIIIEGKPGDDKVGFLIDVPANSDEDAGYSGMEFAVQHILGETGFGFMANYTMVETDNTYDNTSFDTGAEIGISDTSNLIVFYDNYGLQARIAYNWRDQYLSSTSQGTGANPEYVEAYSQIDFNVSYDVAAVEGLSVFFEGINITDEYTRKHGRSVYQVLNVTQTGARYAFGARYSF